MVITVYELIVCHNDYFFERVINLRKRQTFLSSFLVSIHLIGRLDIISPWPDRCPCWYSCSIRFFGGFPPFFQLQSYTKYLRETNKLQEIQASRVNVWILGHKAKEQVFLTEINDGIILLKEIAIANCLVGSVAFCPQRFILVSSQFRNHSFFYCFPNKLFMADMKRSSLADGAFTPFMAQSR